MDKVSGNKEKEYSLEQVMTLDNTDVEVESEEDTRDEALSTL